MTDIEIARRVKLKNIKTIAKKLGLLSKDLVCYGDYKAKIKLDAFMNNKTTKQALKGKLVLVTAINPTKAGIGKTTVSIGLADALNQLGKNASLALREPSVGPVFGIKGGATGGGLSQVAPMEDINLHFNGDFHAITSANNLLCSLIDNHIYFGNSLNINPQTICFNRCLDLNDRSLRDLTINGKEARNEHFNITAASEIMAIMCLATSLDDLKQRLGDIIVAQNNCGEPIYAKDLQAQDAMAILLKDALMPNLVQTLNGTPAIVHCGPFANIAHGCNSILATLASLRLSDYTITEAGFGADLGAEKFIDFKCQKFNLNPDCVVVVATINALKLHGGVSEENLKEPNLEAVKIGLANFIHHINTIKNIYHLNVVATLNQYSTDTQEEIDYVKHEIEKLCDFCVNDVWGKGANGGLDLAKAVIKLCNNKKNNIQFSYLFSESIDEKLKNIVTKVYGGDGVVLTPTAKQTLEYIKKIHKTNLPLIMAKTQFSLSADKSLINVPKGFKVEIRDFELRNGAGFIVALCGKMLLMPALSANPAAVNMKIDSNGVISGLF